MSNFDQEPAQIQQGSKASSVTQSSQENYHVKKGSYWSTRRFFSAFLCALLAGAFALLLAADHYGVFSNPDMSYNDLKYDVQVLSNGDLRVKQRVDVNLRARENDSGDSKTWRRLYQRYEIHPSNLNGISDISVRDVNQSKDYQRITSISPSAAREMTDWDYRRANHWYAAVVTGHDSPQEQSDGYADYQYHPNSTETITNGSGKDNCADGSTSCTVEIGWNIPEVVEADSRTFEITMTFHGVSTAYNDATRFQWEPISPYNAIPIRHISGVIHLPENANRENTKAWLHFTGDSENRRDEDGTLYFLASNVKPAQYLDVVVLMDKNLTRQVERVRKNDIVSETEQRESDQENNWRATVRKRAIKKRVIVIAMLLLTLVVVIMMLKNAFSSYGKSQYNGDILYWRDVPQVTPAAAAAVSTVLFGDSKRSLSRQISASMLSLVNKKVIAIYPGSDSNYASLDPAHLDGNILGQILSEPSHEIKRYSKTSTIVMLPKTQEHERLLNLEKSEKSVLQMLSTVSDEVGSPIFDIDTMNRVLKKHRSADTLINDFENAVAFESGALLDSRSNYGIGVGGLVILVAIIIGSFANSNGLLVTGLLVMFVLVFFAVFYMVYKPTTTLTLPGQQSAGQIIGLKNYLTDFSSFSDKGVSDLTMWGFYLVYATAIGISKKAMEQLAQVCPQVTDSSWLDLNTDFPLIYMAYRPYGMIGGWQNQGVEGFDGIGQKLPLNFSDIGSQIAADFSGNGSFLGGSSDSGGSSGSFSDGGFGGFSGGSGGGSFGGD